MLRTIPEDSNFYRFYEVVGSKRYGYQQSETGREGEREREKERERGMRGEGE